MKRDKSEACLHGGIDEVGVGADLRERLASRHRAIEARTNRIDHDIADELDSLGTEAFLDEVVDAPTFRDKEEVGQAVGDETIDLLRHCPVEAAQARLDMRDGNIELGGHQGGSHGGVDIAHDEDEIGPARQQHRFKPKHDPSSLLGTGARSDFKIYVCVRDVQLLEEHGIHGDIIVLPRVDKADRESVLLAKCTNNWRNFEVVEDRSGEACSLASRPHAGKTRGETRPARRHTLRVSMMSWAFVTSSP